MAAVRHLAAPVAALILAVVYAQGFFGVPLKGRDPIARLTAIGFPQVADEIAALARAQDAPAIVTTSYATTGWLAFYLHPRIAIVQINEEYRWLSAPPPDAQLLHAPLLFVTQQPQKSLPAVMARFTEVTHLAHLDRARNGARIDAFDVYRVSGWRGGVAGREP